MNPLIVHHDGCTDGVGAAWWLARHLAGNPSLTHEPKIRGWAYTDEPPAPDVFTGREIFIVDFCFQPDVLDAMHEYGESIVVLDHHQTAVGYAAAVWW